MVHVTLSGFTQIEEITALHNEVKEVLHSEDYTYFLLALTLRIKVEDIPASKLRYWLFQVYSAYQDCESCKVINSRARKCLRQ